MRIPCKFSFSILHNMVGYTVYKNIPQIENGALNNLFRVGTVLYLGLSNLKIKSILFGSREVAGYFVFSHIQMMSYFRLC